MQSLCFNSISWYSFDCGTDIIICVDESLTASGAPYIEGTLCYKGVCIDADYGKIYKYSITYDECQLDDPDTPLTSCQIEGICLKDCCFTYYNYLLEDIISRLEALEAS